MRISHRQHRRISHRRRTMRRWKTLPEIRHASTKAPETSPHSPDAAAPAPAAAWRSSPQSSPQSPPTRAPKQSATRAAASSCQTSSAVKNVQIICPYCATNRVSRFTSPLNESVKVVASPRRSSSIIDGAKDRQGQNNIDRYHEPRENKGRTALGKEKGKMRLP